MGVVNHEENERRLDGLYLDSLINDLFLAYVGSLRFLNPIFYSRRCFNSLHGRGQYVEGGTFKRFLSEERASHSAFLFTSLLRSNANMIYTFSRIGDAKFPKFTGG